MLNGPRFNKNIGKDDASRSGTNSYVYNHNSIKSHKKLSTSRSLVKNNLGKENGSLLKLNIMKQ